MRKSILTALLFCSLIAGAGQAMAQASGTAPAPGTSQESPIDASQPIKVTLTQAEQTLQVAKGGLVVVSIEGNPTTGFNWEIEEFKPSLLELMESGYAQNAANGSAPAMVGAGGMMTFTFRAKKTGSSPVLFWYKRPWEDGAPVKTHLLTIETK